MDASIVTSPPFASSVQDVDLSGAELEPPAWEETGVRFLLLPGGDAKNIGDHPEVAALREKGWTIGSVQPRVLEGRGSQLLVLLRKSSPQA